MKKINWCFLIFLIFSFSSCQEEKDLIMSGDIDKTSNSGFKSLSTNEMNNIDQFLTEPFYIRKVGQSSNDISYLSFNPKLYIDKSGGRGGPQWHDLRLDKLTDNGQQWLFIKQVASYYPLGYNYEIKNVSKGMYIASFSSKPTLSATLLRDGTYGSGVPFDLEFIPETNLFKIRKYDAYRSSSSSGTSSPRAEFSGYLTSKSAYNGDLIYSKESNQSRQTWQIIPCEEFEVIEFSFKIANGFDRIRNVPKVWSTTLENNKNGVTNREYSIKQTTETTSSFSSTTGVKVTKKITVNSKLGIPKLIKSAGGLDVSLATEVTKENSYTYQEGVQEKKTIEISEKISFVQQPWQTVKIETVSSEYDTSVTYIAKIRGLNSGKIFYLTGKWDGVIVGDTYIKVVDVSKGTIVAQKTISR